MINHDVISDVSDISNFNTFVEEVRNIKWIAAWEF